MSALKDFLIFLGIVTLILIVCTIAKAGDLKILKDKDGNEYSDSVSYVDLSSDRTYITAMQNVVELTNFKADQKYYFGKDCFKSIKNIQETKDEIIIEFDLDDSCKDGAYLDNENEI